MSGADQPDEMLLCELTVRMWRRFDPADGRPRPVIETETTALERFAMAELERSLTAAAARIARKSPHLLCRWRDDEPPAGDVA